MNEAIYQMADSGGSIRIVVQKKTDGNYIIGISNGRDRPLIRQGSREAVDAEFESALPAYLEELKNTAIEAKLRAAEESPVVSEDNKENDKEAENIVPAPPAPVTIGSNPEEQTELDFGF